MKIFLIAGDLPSSSHTMRAANRVLDALIGEMCDRGLDITLQVISASDLSEAERRVADHGRLNVLPPLEKKDYFRAAAGANLLRLSSRLYSRLANPIEFFYHATRLRPVVDQRIQACNADVVLLFWNAEGLAATYGNHRVPKIAYYGVPDHMASLARFEDRELFGVHMSAAKAAMERRNLKAWEQAHIELMKDCDVVTNLCAEHAEYYTQSGHPRSLYIPNIWPVAPDINAAPGQARRSAGKLKIFGSLGRLSATGNTYGLKYIGEQLAPRLDQKLGADGYEIDIFGGGTPTPEVDRLLQRKSIKIRGWVQDIDAEIRSADVFLVANNTGPYRGAHTRFLHAWSLRACCVGHTYNSRAMPEMVHMSNALLGETPDEIVELLVTAYRDRDLRQRIAESGWNTFHRHFTPRAAVGRLLPEIEKLAKTRKAFAR